MITKVLVTGANGQLGKTIKELYSQNNLNLEFVFTNKKSLDITEENQISKLFDANNFKYCINCAAYTNVEQAEKTPEIAFRINADGVKKLVKKCKETNTVLVHISTDYVFDGEKEEAYTPLDLPNPINEYGKSKLEGEIYIKKKLERYFIIRTSWLYSKKYGLNFYTKILNKIKSNKELFVTSNQVGCPTDTVNLAKYIIGIIITDSSFGIYHFSDSKVMTWYDFAKSILKEQGVDQKIKLVKTNNYRTFAKRPKNSVLRN